MKNRPSATQNRKPVPSTGTKSPISKTLPLLLEIGCEEIPARFLPEAERQFGERLGAALAEARLLPGMAGEGMTAAGSGPPLQCFSTPRRLACYAPAILTKQPDRVEEVLGPPVKVAFDSAGEPTRAAQSFGEKQGVAIKDLTRVSTPKGEYLAARKITRGRPAMELLPGILPQAVLGMSFPKSMYWAGISGPRFVRPIRWILARLGEGKQGRLVPFEIGGVESGGATFGHRAYRKAPLRPGMFKQYIKLLRRAFVELDKLARVKSIQVKSDALLEDDLRRVEDPGLELWLADSVEWPSALRGGFDERFLHLPREILITVMRDHQHYFAVEDRKGNLRPQFVAILNMDSDRRGLIRHGHERVLAARLADAEFFWDADQRRPLAERQGLLERVTYQAQLGSYAAKVRRMQAIAQHLTDKLLEQRAIEPASAGYALRAVELAKTDLTTQMVQEFPELQGIVGGLYARAQGEAPEVAEAIYDHYRPTGAEDTCPRSIVGAIVSLADKLDSVAGGFAVGNQPTGSSDPFALRRQANAIIKVLLEVSLPLSLKQEVEAALQALDIPWRMPQVEVFRGILDFFEERLRYYLETVRGFRYDTVRAVLAAGWDIPADAMRRVEALESLRGSANLEALCVAAKRIKNILSKSASAKDWEPGDIDPGLLKEAEERQLEAELRGESQRVTSLRESGDYRVALEQISTLRPSVDRFFDKVLVMAEDRALRQNRLRLLGKLDELFSSIASFAEIAP